MVAEMSQPWGHRKRQGRGQCTGADVTRRSPLAALASRQPDGYPPDLAAEAVKTVLAQAELLCAA